MAAVIISTLFSIMVGFNNARSQDDSGENNNSGIVKSPLSHQSYTANLLTLKIAFPTVFSPKSEHFGSDEYYYITYSIDGGENIRIQKESISYEISHGILIPNNLTATVALPPLNDGYHTLTVNAREPYIVPGHSGYYYQQETVDFTVNTIPTPIPTPEQETQSPPPTQTPNPTPTPTSTSSTTLSPSPTPTPTPSPTVTPTQSPNSTISRSANPSSTRNPTSSSSPSSSFAPSHSISESPSLTNSPSPTEDPEQFAVNWVEVELVVFVLAVGGLAAYFLRRRYKPAATADN